MKQVLQQNISSQLTLTPQLKQSLKLLQLPSQALEQELQIALDSNPLLERVENNELYELKNSEVLVDKLDISASCIPQPIAEATDPSIEIERTDYLVAEQNLTQSFDSQRTDTGHAPNQIETNSTNSYTEYSQFVTYQETLFESLRWQVQMTGLSERDKLIADYLINSLDNDGYIKSSLKEIAGLLEPSLKIGEDELAAVLSLLKTLEPIGVGARDLPERLLILLDHGHCDSKYYDLAKSTIENHLALLGTHDYSRLKKQLGISDETLAATLEIITDLNPRITTQFNQHQQDQVIPDAIVKKINDQWVARLNPRNETKLRINETYSKLLERDNKRRLDKQSSEFIQSNLTEANAIIKSLMSRYDTLLLVTQCIVKRQQAFFEHGEEQMKPMVLADIAEQLDLHESTISRATAGKYLLSARGVFELKYFFSTSLNSVDGTTSSSTAIRSLIKTMIGAESKKKPLSDNKITKELEQHGHIVARRTVAKYRESMNIAPSNQRKLLSQ